jgi:hypothetical protein
MTTACATSHSAWFTLVLLAFPPGITIVAFVVGVKMARKRGPAK